MSVLRSSFCLAIGLWVMSGCGQIGLPSEAARAQGDSMTQGGDGPPAGGDSLVPGDTPVPGGDSLGSGDTAVAGPPITLNRVTFNQAVEISVISSRSLIAPTSRSAPLISRRPALVRVYWDVVDPGALAGGVPFDAELTVTSSASGTQTLSNSLTINGPPDPSTMGGAFTFPLTADQMQADTTIAVSLSTGGMVIDGLPTAALSPWAETMTVDVVIVPTCGFDPTQQERDDLYAYVYNTFPTNDLRIDWRPSAYPTVCDEGTATFDTLPTLRTSESSPPYRFYGAIIGNSCGGVSHGLDPTSQSAVRTFSNCDWRDFGPTQDLFAHELGHQFGRPHSFEDSSYPYENSNNCGVRESYGYGLIDNTMPNTHFSNDVAIGYSWVPMNQLIPPTSTVDCDIGIDSWSDMMSYNYPYWVSDYSYAQIAENVRLVSSWITGGVSGPVGMRTGAEGRLSVPTTFYGNFLGDGRVSWTKSSGHEVLGEGLSQEVVAEGSAGTTRLRGVWVLTEHDHATGPTNVRTLVVHTDTEDISAFVVGSRRYEVGLQ